MNKVVVGYGTKYKNETLEDAAEFYSTGEVKMLKSVKETLEFIEEMRKNRSVGKREKVEIIKFMAEVDKL